MAEGGEICGWPGGEEYESGRGTGWSDGDHGGDEVYQGTLVSGELVICCGCWYYCFLLCHWYYCLLFVVVVGIVCCLL